MNCFISLLFLDAIVWIVPLSFYKGMSCKNYLAELTDKTRYFPWIPQIDKT